MTAFAAHTDGEGNWGRWSEADEIGTLNLLTPDHVLRASQLVTSGRVVSLARQLRHDVVRVRDRTAPTHVLTVDAGDYAVGAHPPGGVFLADDFISMPLATGTHIDALAHVWSRDGLYNGHDPSNVRSRGAKRCGIDKVSGIVTSGVLADIPRLHGIRALPPSHVVSVAELEAATDGRGHAIDRGDAVLIRTGWLTRQNIDACGHDVIETQEPGIGVEAAAWLAARDIALVGADTLGVEVLPAENDHPGVPVHVTLLNRFGIHIVELLALDDLAALDPGRFLLVIAPLPISGAVNSPVNPIAIL